MLSSEGASPWLVEVAVQRLVADWPSRAGEHRPWGAWVVRWGAIGSNEELEAPWPAVPLRAAWFLTDSGFVLRDVVS